MTLKQWSKKLGRPILDDVATEPGPTAVVEPARKPRKARPDPKYEAQYRYQREAVACRAWLRDNDPKRFKAICRQIMRRGGMGATKRRRPTYRMNKKRREENGTTSEKGSGTSTTKE